MKQASILRFFGRENLVPPKCPDTAASIPGAVGKENAIPVEPTSVPNGGPCNVQTPSCLKRKRVGSSVVSVTESGSTKQAAPPSSIANCDPSERITVQSKEAPAGLPAERTCQASTASAATLTCLAGIRSQPNVVAEGLCVEATISEQQGNGKRSHKISAGTNGGCEPIVQEAVAGEVSNASTWPREMQPADTAASHAAVMASTHIPCARIQERRLAAREMLPRGHLREVAGGLAGDVTRDGMGQVAEVAAGDSMGGVLAGSRGDKAGDAAVPAHQSGAGPRPLPSSEVMPSGEASPPGSDATASPPAWDAAVVGGAAVTPSHVPDGSGRTNKSDYELQREANVRRNLELLATLGLASGPPPQGDPCKPPRAKAPRVAPPTRCDPPARCYPLRTRCPRQAPGLGGDDASTVRDIVPMGREAEPVDPISFDDSSVHHYLCSARQPEDVGQAGPGGTGSTCRVSNKLAGFADSRMEYSCPELRSIYGMDIMGGGHLLAAGGHNGMIAVWGAARDAHASGPSLVQEPLLSFKAHKGWVCQVQFLRPQGEGGGHVPCSSPIQPTAPLLLTASNDACVSLWDISKSCSTGAGRGGGGGAARPRLLWEADHLHTGGIFSMQQLGSRLLTASKDSSVVLSDVTPSGVSSLRVVTGHHGGVIKCARFRDTDVAADCGNDGDVCILDFRCKDPCVLTVAGAHPCAANFVAWSPRDPCHLISAGNDDAVRLHDVRVADARVSSAGAPGCKAESLYTFTGHKRPGAKNSIYQPTFVSNGRYVACSGEGSERLSLYCLMTGKAVSRGSIGFNCTNVCWFDNGDGSGQLLAAQAKGVKSFLPTWQW
eukprot:jgi/Mesvir1/16745/Mv15125-RA.1